MMIKCDLRFGKYLACTLMYCGDFASKQDSASLKSIKDLNMTFVDWFPNKYEVGSITDFLQ
jgi:tubulin alpha